MSKPKIFISYRREDEPWAAQVVQMHLKHYRCEVFLDVNMKGGIKWDKEIDERVSTSNVMIVMIGPRWLSLLQERAASDDQDIHYHEVYNALKDDKHVIPLIIDNAQLPQQELLPEGLKELCKNNELRLRHKDQEQDLERLVQSINERYPLKLKLWYRLADRRHATLLALQLIGGLSIFLVLALFMSFSEPSPPISTRLPSMPLHVGSVKAGILDAGILDAGILDAGILDAGILDAGKPPVLIQKEPPSLAQFFKEYLLLNDDAVRGFYLNSDPKEDALLSYKWNYSALLDLIDNLKEDNVPITFKKAIKSFKWLGENAHHARLGVDFERGFKKHFYRVEDFYFNGLKDSSYGKINPIIDQYFQEDLKYVQKLRDDLEICFHEVKGSVHVKLYVSTSYFNYFNISTILKSQEELLSLESSCHLEIKSDENIISLGHRAQGEPPDWVSELTFTPFKTITLEKVCQETLEATEASSQLNQESREILYTIKDKLDPLKDLSAFFNSKKLNLKVEPQNVLQKLKDACAILPHKP